MELVINLRSPVSVTGAGQRPRLQPRAVLAGQISRYLLLAPSGDTEIVAARFTPAGTALFFGFALAEATDGEVPLDAFGPPWNRLESHLQDAVPLERVRRLEQALLAARRNAEDRDLRVKHAVDLIREGGGALPVEGIARAAGFSARQLERVFARNVGLGPKHFSRIVRFQRVLRSIEGGDPHWSEAAFDAGLYDQAHLAREFREFSGSAPSAYFAHSTPMGEAMLR